MSDWLDYCVHFSIITAKFLFRLSFQLIKASLITYFGNSRTVKKVLKGKLK